MTSRKKIFKSRAGETGTYPEIFSRGVEIFLNGRESFGEFENTPSKL